MTVLAAWLLANGWAAADDAKSSHGVTFIGRVVEVESGKPVEGAAVIVERSIRGVDPRTLPPWAGASTLETDADGRFRLSFPPEQLAERRLTILLRIKHSGFASRKSLTVLLAEILRGQARGEEPFFTTIKLEGGVEYTGQVLTPGGKPVAAIPYVFENWERGTNPSRHFTNDDEGQTDDRGRIHHRMPKSHSVAIYLGPPRSARARFPYAPYRHFWGTDNPSGNPDIWAPTDLGRIVLARGVRVSGRLVDTEGRPIAGQTIQANPIRGPDQHSATTEADGSFALGPLRPANYMIEAERQNAGGGINPDTPPLSGPIRAIRPVKIYLKEGITPEPIVLHEMPTDQVEVRYVDSQGRPALGGPAGLSGTLPNDQKPPNPPGPRHKGSGLSSEINGPEPPYPVEQLQWGLQDYPGADGRIAFPVPKGLQDAMLQTYPFDEAIAFKTRLTPDGPLKHFGGGQLGPIEDDRRITIVCYRAPTVLVTLKSENGPVPDDMTVGAGFNINGDDYVDHLIRQPDGRYRSQSLMPDHEYEISGWQRRYISRRLQRINLPEGGSTEVTLMLRKRPAPPAVGQPAPPFSVRTLDGRAVSLGSLRGKTILLHFWSPVFGLRYPATLTAIHDRFGKDDRFAMLGFCQAIDSEGATRAIQSAGVSWPQALLRDRYRDPIVIDYGAFPYSAFVIGPDGKLIASDRNGVGLEKAVQDALSRK